MALPIVQPEGKGRQAIGFMVTSRHTHCSFEEIQAGMRRNSRVWDKEVKFNRFIFRFHFKSNKINVLMLHFVEDFDDFLSQPDVDMNYLTIIYIFPYHDHFLCLIF